MSDEPALLAAIRAHPDEDTPRLVYADWFDENGQPERAEFIRLQCLAEPSEEQEGRAFDLEEQNRGRWLAQLGVPQFAEARWEFRRGFPEGLHTEGEQFLERFEAFARVPWLRALVLHGAGNATVRDLLNRSWPAQWTELRLFHDWNDEDAPSLFALANSPQVQRLRLLWLSRYFFGEAAQPALALLRAQLRNRLEID